MIRNFWTDLTIFVTFVENFRMKRASVDVGTNLINIYAGFDGITITDERHRNYQEGKPR